MTDPWKPYEPSEAHPWNRARAAHLFRRAGFGASWADLESATKKDPSSVVDELFSPEPESFAKQMKTLERQVRAAGNVEQLPQVWLYRMLKTPTQLLEKTTLFWHGHFATSAGKVDGVGMMLDQNHLLRSYALGKFAPLVQGISRDPAMLTYLDSRENRKTRPNENYARELMELFCLGLGNYTEDDIKQVARAFTGWEIRNDRFRFNKYQHDYGTKEFLGEAGKFGGKDAVQIVLQQSASTRFIARKLIQYFATDYPVSEELVTPIADELGNHQFDIGRAIRMILSSQYFFESAGKKIRSPVELGIGLLRNLEATGNLVGLAGQMRELGQLPYYPPNVKGWPGGRTWINSATLISRVNLVDDLLQDEKTRMTHGDLRKLMRHYGVGSAKQAVAFFEELLCARPLSLSTRDNLENLIGKDFGQERLHQLVVAISALPEFQLV